MATKASGASPAKRRTYDEAFKPEALHLADERRSTQAAAQQLGREEVTRDPEVRARLQRAEQALNILRNALVTLVYRKKLASRKM